MIIFRGPPIWAWCLTAMLCGCARPMPVSGFAGTQPSFDPVSFFTGHTRSWGVLENRSGQPTEPVVTDCVGEMDGADRLRMLQTLRLGEGRVQRREWYMWRTGAHTYAATANDMIGTVIGEAAGRGFHWRWVLATSPGNPLRNVIMDQWMYLMDGGAMVNRTTISKLGFILAEVTEQFAHVDGAHSRPDPILGTPVT